MELYLTESNFLYTIKENESPTIQTPSGACGRSIFSRLEGIRSWGSVEELV